MPGLDHNALPARDPARGLELWNGERNERRLAVFPEAAEGALLSCLVEVL